MVDISNYPYHFKTNAHHHRFMVDCIFTSCHFGKRDGCNVHFGISEGVVG